MVVVGATASLVMSPLSPAMADAVDRRESQSYGSAFVVLNLAYALGMLLGPVGGSALVQSLGIRTAFLLVALGYGAYGLAMRKVEA
jgi:MFS family permease